MRIRLAAGVTLLLMLLAAIVLSNPLHRLKVVGILRQERFYGGLPAHHWFELIEEGTGNQRYEAILALGRDPAAIPALTGRLKDPIPLLRQMAAVELARFGPAARDAVPALTAMLHDDERSCRQAATDALQQIAPAASPAP